MNETDIKKCIKNGYAWSSCGDKPEKTPTKDYTRSQLKTFDGLHATKHSAQLAIATRREDEPANNHAEVKCDMPETLMLSGKLYKRLAEGEPREIGDVPVDGSQTHRFGSIWYRPVASHETPVGETQGKEVVTGETQDPEPVKWTTYDTSDTIDCNHVTPEWQAWKARQDVESHEQAKGETQPKVGNKYHRTIHGVSEGSLVVDVYNVLDAFGVTCPACQHAIKKLLCAGLRNKGSRLQDLTEAEASVKRAVELEQQRKEGAK